MTLYHTSDQICAHLDEHLAIALTTDQYDTRERAILDLINLATGRETWRLVALEWCLRRLRLLDEFARTAEEAGNE